MDQNLIFDLLGENLVYILLTGFIILVIFLGVRIVPQSEKHVVERFGRLHSVLGPGINLVVPFLDIIAHKISILERQLPTAEQDAITADNVLVKVETSVFYRITEPEKTVYRIRDVDATIATTVAGIVRSEIGKMELDEVQSNRSELIGKIRESVRVMVDEWGIIVTRAEILDVNLYEATRAAMLQQLNAERARRAQVTEAEGQKRAVELAVDAQLYEAEQIAKARRIQADAEAYATQVVAKAIADNGLEAAQYQVAFKQVEALTQVGQGQGSNTVIVPAHAMDAFADAFKMLRGEDHDVRDLVVLGRFWPCFGHSGNRFARLCIAWFWNWCCCRRSSYFAWSEHDASQIGVALCNCVIDHLGWSSRSVPSQESER